ncbi:MAG: hypothetical protein HY905_02380 [Deltaproteobacteria bacterium]|nr:hypothetical protein [Deltaproteobacteria bacterium]
MTIRIHVLAVLAGLTPTACQHTYIELNPDAPDRDADVADVGADTADADAEEGGAEGGDVAEVVVLPPPPCGNGVVDDGEECDDGNQEDRDGCTWDCLLGDGDPVGPRDPAARPYVVEGPPVVLPPVDYPTVVAVGGMGLTPMDDGTLVASWNRPEVSPGIVGTIWSRFLWPGGTLARGDVGIVLASGWTESGLTRAARATDFTLAWRAGIDGLWRARLTVEGGLVEPPASLLMSPNSDLPALAPHPSGYFMTWYDGTDTLPCVHDGDGSSRILLGRLSPDGTIDAATTPTVLEADLGAHTPSRIATGADGTVGVLWWRAGAGAGSDCSLRFGAADTALTTVSDGGTLGVGTSGRIVDAGNAFRMGWRRRSDIGPIGLGFAAFDRGATLLDAPVSCDLPFAMFFADTELAAGDNGLVTVLRGGDVATGIRLFFVRADLMGRTGDTSCGALEVDTSCTADRGCEPGPFGVAWAGDAFVVVYFVTLDPTGPSPTTEMRMVRLVPAP